MTLLIVVAVLCVGGWVSWLYFGSTAVAEGNAAEALTQVEDSWRSDPEAVLIENPTKGVPYWKIRIPALGDDWEWAVTTGVDRKALKTGIGWYPATSQPGQVGNFAVAGQCITGAQPFRHLGELEVGDEVHIEGAAATHVYEIISPPGNLTVQKDESWVLDPVPGDEDAAPTQAFITLTTCEDLYPTPDRSVGFGVLTASETK